MKRKVAVAISLVAVFALVGFASAISDVTEVGEKNMRQIKNEQRDQVKAQREAMVAIPKQEKEIWKTQRQDALMKIRQEKETLRNTFKQKFTAEKCARIQERVQNKATNFAGKKEKHTSTYTNLVNRINKFIARFDEAKLDTTAIKSHLVELQTMIDKFKASYAAYATGFGAMKIATCENTEGEFKGALLESKTLLKAVHADAAAIRTYVRTVILADMKALKAQMPKKAEKPESDNDANKAEADND